MNFTPDPRNARPWAALALARASAAVNLVCFGLMLALPATPFWIIWSAACLAGSLALLAYSHRS